MATIGNIPQEVEQRNNWYKACYPNFNPFWQDLNSYLESFDRFLKVIEGSLHASWYASILQNKPNTDYLTASQPITTARTIVSLSRLTMIVEKLVSGKMFFKKDDDNQQLVTRNFIDIVMDVILLGARALSSVLWMNKSHFLTLSSKANQSIGITVTCAYTSLGMLGIGRDGGKLINKINQAKHGKEVDLSKHVANMICDGIDFLAMPWDNGVGLIHEPRFALAGAVLCALSGMSYLIKEWAYS